MKGKLFLRQMESFSKRFTCVFSHVNKGLSDCGQQVISPDASTLPENSASLWVVSEGWLSGLCGGPSECAGSEACSAAPKGSVPKSRQRGTGVELFSEFSLHAIWLAGRLSGPVPPESRQGHEGDTWFALLQKNRFPIVRMLRPQVAVHLKNNNNSKNNTIGTTKKWNTQ